MDEQTRTNIEAAAWRSFVRHLQNRTDVQNIDLMNLSGFCRNCLYKWLLEAAENQGAELSKDDAIGCKQRLGGMLKYYYREAA